MKKRFIILFGLSLLAVPFQNFSHALTYNEIVQGQAGKVLDSSTVSATITSSPNPVQICNGSTATTVTITANAAVNYDVRIGSATGDLFAQQAANTQTVKQTGNWVSNGMVFSVVDTNSHAVLSSTTITFTTQGCAGSNSTTTSISLSPNPIKTCIGSTATTTITALAPVDYEVHISSPTGDLFSKQLANVQLKQATGNWVTNGMSFYVIDSNSKATLASASAVVSSTGCDFSNQPSAFNNIKSVTWYEFGPTYAQSLANLQQQIPKIKQAGFNTVWLVTPWNELNPKPLTNPPVYNDADFSALKQTLDVLRTNGMQALIGLNYLGQGWSPEGIDYCSWTSNFAQYQAFVNYSSEFLRRIDGYQDVANILVFTENAESCNVNAYSNAAAAAAQLQSTLGKFPNQLPSDLRAKFKIGYHDYDLINLGWAQGASPIASPNPFDFVSMVAYDLETKTNDQITTEINSRASHFKALYPNTPLLLGEFGARSCSQDQDSNQSRVDTAIIQTAQTNKFGFNLWGWRPAAADECSKQLSGYGYAITNVDGTSKPAAAAIMALLGGSALLNPSPVLQAPITQTPATSTPITAPIIQTPTTGLTMPSLAPVNNPETPPINYPFPSGSLVNDNGTIYFISGTVKVPFTTWQAFVGLGYSTKQVVKGDLSSYTISQNYTINTANAEHPWGSWLISGQTIYYSTSEGLIGVPSLDVFTNNGGDLKEVVKANKYDVANIQPTVTVLGYNDSKVIK